MSEALAVVVAGLAQGVPLFVIASGLTLIFGVMHVLNFSHGALFMLGAFAMQMVAGSFGVSFGRFAVGVVLAGVAVAVVGVITELGVFRRLYGARHESSLLAAFGLFLLLEGVARQVWGTRPRTQQLPSELSGPLELLGARLASYDLVMIFTGVLIAVLLRLLMSRTRFGRETRAVAEDRTMALALGVRARRVATWVFVLGSALAGVAGALTAPMVSIEPSLAADFLVQAFVVIIVGGVGSIAGSLVAAAMLGITESVLISYAPVLAGFSFYIAVTVILLFRPYGLFGRPAVIGLAR